MSTTIELLLTFGVGLIASILGAIAGGGGLISIPFLILLGLPPQVAIATNRFGSVGLSSAALYQFQKAKKFNGDMYFHLLYYQFLGVEVVHFCCFLFLNRY